MAVAEKTSAQVLIAPSGEGVLAKPKEQTKLWYAKMRAMRKDPSIRLARAMVMAPVMLSQWSVEVEADAPAGARELIQQCLVPMRLHILRTAFAGCIDFGWAPYEKIFGLDAQGRTIIAKLKPLLQDPTEILVVPETGAFNGFMQKITNEPVELTVGESLLINLDVEGTDWYGQSLLDNAQSAYDAAVECDKGARRYDKKVAGAHWVVYYPIGTSSLDGQETDNFEVAKRILARLEASGTVAVPRKRAEMLQELGTDVDKEGGWQIELLSDSGAQVGFVDRMRYLDSLKARALELPERAAMEGQFGTKAESAEHADLALTNMDFKHQVVVQHVNWHCVNALLRLNFGPGTDGKVYIRPAALQDAEKAYMRELYKAVLSNEAGFLKETEVVDFEALRDRIGIPMLPQFDVDTSGATDPTKAPLTDGTEEGI